MSDETSVPTTQPAGFWPTALGIIGTFLIFAAILAVVYVPKSGVAPAPVQNAEDTVPRTPEARKAKLEELKGAEKKASATYEVLDPKTKVVRMPIDRAMELVVTEQAKPAAK